MRLMLINRDPSIFSAGSATRERLTKLGSRLEQLDIVVFSTGAEPVAELAPNIHAYSTRSSTKLFYVLDAYRLARDLPPPDIISAQDPFDCGLTALLLSRHFRIPFATEIHTDPFSSAFIRHSFMNRLRLIVSAFVLRCAAGGYAVSRHVQKELQRRFNKEFALLPIPVDLARFKAVRREPIRGSVLWIGRLEPEKRPELAIRAVAEARAAGHNVRLTMLGSGSLLDKLHCEAAKRGIQEYVAFPGWKDPVPYLAVAELVLVTSAYEGYGLGIVEALASGVPVLATDVGVARDAGAVIAGDDYAAALRTMLEHPFSPGTLKLSSYASDDDYFDAVVGCYARIIAHAAV